MTDAKTPDIVTITGGDNRRTDSITTLLDDGNSSRNLHRLLLGVVALVIAFLLWAIFTPVDELARARGEIKPLSGVQLVQSMEGGILAELLVKEDDYVEKGSVIARFAATDVQKEQLQAQVRRVAYQIDLERWGALAEGRTPDFSRFNSYPQLVAEAEALYTREAALNVAQTKARFSASEQQRAALAGAEQELPSAQRELDAANDVLERYRQGVESDLISKVQLANAEQQAAAAQRRAHELESRLNELQTAIDSADADLEATRQGIVEQARTKRSELLEKIAELDAEIEALDARHGRSALLAPVSGYIKDLPDTRTGAVISAGGTVAEIVPTEGGIILEAMVTPRDIGFVSQGQRASVKVDAFDYSRFGAVQGTVETISPSAFKQPQTGEPFYKVQIALDKSYVSDDKSRRLIPGMTAEADIVTGRKTVFEYLLKPVYVNTKSAFHER
ncbi:HlyD family type I secretion periplasmic adaptor subunit [Gilvimarinus agarilyticus]|uniref:HlyD family type I secretion periplasmic adaptor subunit n=1 Tax=Gilvimarinus agarilyticus TaxID=679259 RepID=UPI00059F0D67|nr:HlyD family type I secretion periplasmic adaptor subunit [Gilvimarinus agarilyticus]